ncbi:aldehyde dehydrogenase family protein [Paraglaciecola hydrolytica]|uniref:Aldehyde dehydrogenase n=1 Tax=Paraglaciecola hydrolytica TaxID=1799789 RepID=A0A136A519_9ALTE|nr:aldehyde dehydrogenase family protein [Paraglaciecola hydrolytica]KXI30220.1 aldehyde dehydrogenase [Paraglaciecola hydrolytica]
MQADVITNQVNHLKTTFSSGITRDLKWRLAQLKQLKLMLVEQEAAFLAGLKSDLGKSEQEAWTSEIGFVVSDIDHTVKHLISWAKARKVSTPMFVQPGKSYLLPEPLGTVLIIGAWNYPLQLVLAPLVAAIAAGNCAVLKPSELSVKTAELLALYLPQYLDQNAYQVVTGAVLETTELLKQAFDHILYTGGEGVGKIVMRAAAEHLTPVTLELGGKCPCIVDSTTDLTVTAARIAWSKWMNAGQTCVAPDYVLIEKSFLTPFIAALKQKISEFYGSDISKSKDYGRIVNARHFARLTSYLQDQDVILGGEMDVDTNYIAPTLVLNPSADSSVMLEEIFGPILIILTVDKIQDAIPLINSKPKPLALYLYTKNTQFEQQVLSQTSAGSVGVNDGMMFMANPSLPFGGVGNSGMGAYHGKFGFDTFSHLKSVLKRSFLFDVALRYPPFSASKLKILKKLL